MSGIVDPSTPEREARERVTELARAPGVRFMGEGARFAEGLDAYAAAVRARALADVAGWVEGMERGRNYEPHEEERAWGWDEALDALLAKLREAK